MANFDWGSIDKLAKANVERNSSKSLESLEIFLKRWWCINYNRPFKDPLLDEYTLEELSYEFLTHYYLDPNNRKDNKEDEDILDDEEWIKQSLANLSQEQKEKAEAKLNGQKVEPDMPEINTKF